MENKRIIMGSDHAGFGLKLKVKAHLEARGFEVADVGTHTPEAIAAGEADLGILVCGTGIGMSMAANKHKGIRAACCENTFSARMTRMHNDANVLCFGERVIGYGLACDMADLFVDTPFEGGRHQARVDDLNALDAGK